MIKVIICTTLIVEILPKKTFQLNKDNIRSKFVLLDVNESPV